MYKRIRTLEERLKVNRDHVYALRALIKQELEGSKCSDCPESDERALDFDHVWGVKLFSISQAISKMVSLQELKVELAKCVIRCRNCHAKRHDYGNGEHYYTSKNAIERIVSRVERSVVKAFLAEQAKALAEEQEIGASSHEPAPSC